MENITDTAIQNHLKKLNIKHNPAPYTHIHNNNHAITDSQNFFIKINTNPRGLQIELETLTVLTYAPQPLHPQLTKIEDTYILTTKYIPSTPVTPETLTILDIQSIIQQLQQINTINPETYKQPRKLSETLNLIITRLQNPEITPQQHQQLEILINKYIKPYIIKHENSKTFAHTDLHLKNILKKKDNTVFLIDYEGIKPSPVEADLAGLYQTLQQNNQTELYTQFHDAFIESYPHFKLETLKESILFKNTLTTTAAARLAPEIFNERIQIMLDTLTTGEPPTYLPPVV